MYVCRYTFYLDFLASEFDDRTQNALLHLREQSDYVRVLGSYPKVCIPLLVCIFIWFTFWIWSPSQGSELIGPVKMTLNSLANIPVTTEYPSISVLKKLNSKAPLNIGIIGTSSSLALA